MKFALYLVVASLFACNGDKSGEGEGEGEGEGYHPDGFSSPEVHGLEAKLQTQECTDCHGADLTGSGDAVSCDSCHEEGWRTSCTYCHGGDETDGGAPPRDMDGESDPTAISFPHHTTHLTDTSYKVGFACESCHAVPTDVLTSGHLFVDDETPAVAELDFSGGLSPNGTWDGAGTCGSLYCHGDGRGHNGEVTVGTEIDDCTSCHPGHASSRGEISGMSGEHGEHIEEGVACGSCHGDTVSSWDTLVDTSLHVDGAVEIALETGMTWTASNESCDGSCHGERHDNSSWDR